MMDLEPRISDIEGYSDEELERFMDGRPEEFDRTYHLYLIAIAGKMFDELKPEDDESD